MKLSCKRGMQIAIYTAMFGRTQQGTLECPLHHWRAPSVVWVEEEEEEEEGAVRSHRRTTERLMQEGGEDRQPLVDNKGAEIEETERRDCQAGVALQVVMGRCQGKKSCLVRASTRDFGDPCYSGTRKYLSVIYTCVK
ncbi:hypothetical protein CRUP_028944 [Coryphaenoides rupestris]|nr:hypothetical protein CRUP_028944 [Coryphaenoides rupestris]